MLDRRRFLKGAAAGALALSGAGSLTRTLFALERRDYRGPRAILVRFGGGVRRRETLLPGHSFSPYLLRELAPRGALFPGMEISDLKDVQTSHGQGTLFLLTGKYHPYQDVEMKPLSERFEAPVPTLFEGLRKAFDVPEHRALIVNGEDRLQEEFYTFSNHPGYGQDFRAGVLSLYRFKCHLRRRQLAEGRADPPAERELARLESLDYRVKAGGGRQGPELEAFWERWREQYGESGLMNARGDRLIAELACRAIQELKPVLMMVNFNDCDYVHWGIPEHYTRGIAVMDECLRRLAVAVETDPEYRGNTLLVVAPDCGRDDNRFKAIPFQHHFGDRSAHEVFALFTGPGIPAGKVLDARTEQVDVAPTVAGLMGFPMPYSEGRALL